MVPKPVWLLVGLIASYCSLMYESVIAKTMVTLTDDAVVWESLSIGFYLLGIGIGALKEKEFCRLSPLEYLVRIEIALSILGAVMVPLVLFSHIGYRIYMLDYGSAAIRPLDVFMLSLQSLTIFLGVLSGLEIAMLLRVFKDREAPLVLAIFHGGALIAGLTFALYFLGHHSMVLVGAWTAALNCGLALFLYWQSSGEWNLRIGLATSVLVSILVALGADGIEQLSRKNFYYNGIRVLSRDGASTMVGPVRPLGLWEFLQAHPRIVRTRTPYQDIELVQTVTYDPLDASRPVPAGPEDVSLFLDGHFQLNTQNERLYHEFLAHVPIMASTARPHTILVLGGGDGFLLRELLKYEGSQLTLVEIDPAIIALAPALNNHAFNDPRVHVVVGDALAFLRNHNQTFDAIYLDFPRPYSTEGTRLYSSEFFRLVARRLDPKGFLAMDAPVDTTDWDSKFNQVLFVSLQAGGFAGALVFTAEQEPFVLARKDAGPQTLAYRDLGIDLQSLSRTSFAALSRQRPVAFGTPAPNRVNSILKPVPVSYKDPYF